MLAIQETENAVAASKDDTAGSNDLPADAGPIPSLAAPDTIIPNDVCVTDPPSAQAALDLIEGWVSTFPQEFGVTVGRGDAMLFDDPRVRWVFQELRGVAGMDILELGPLEGGHTYMLDRAGAKSITSIEGNKRCFLKCLLTKEVTDLKSAKFLFGDFMPWLEQSTRRFDAIWASGVLYHMVDPIKFLKLLAARTDRIYLWTHFYPDGYAPEVIEAPLAKIETREIDGHDIAHYLRSYMGAEQNKVYCGGVYSASVWLQRSDILGILQREGFNRLQIEFEAPLSATGASFALIARRV